MAQDKKSFICHMMILPKIEPIVLLEEVKIQSVVDEKKYQQWVFEHIKNLPPKNVPESARNNAQDKINSFKNIQTKTNKQSLL